MRSESPGAGTFAIVPLNRLQLAKSRLADARTDRPSLVWDMLVNVVGALVGCRSVARVAVVTPEGNLEGPISALGAIFLPDPGGGLIGALESGRSWAHQQGAEALLVVLGDLPWLTSQEVEGLLRLAPSRGVVLAPDRDASGTNALFTRPVDAMPFRFGENSFPKHLEEARTAGLQVEIFQSRGTRSDIDVPDHLEELAWKPEAV